MLNGHGQRGNHEKYLEEKHGVDHGNNLDSGFLFHRSGEFHNSYGPLVS
jgi:hypothetical protein